MTISRFNLRVFVGYDSREDIAYQVCKASILEHTPGAEVYPLRLDDLRERGLYWRQADPLSSTEFSFSRFLVPALTNYRGRALFMDCDFLVRKDLTPLLEYSNPDIAVWCGQARIQADRVDEDGRSSATAISAQKLVVVHVVQLRTPDGVRPDPGNGQRGNGDVPASVHVVQG
jgi:hypothetical protein